MNAQLTISSAINAMLISRVSEWGAYRTNYIAVVLVLFFVQASWPVAIETLLNNSTI